MAWYSTYTTRYTLNSPGGSTNLKVSNTSATGTYTITETDATVNGSVTNGQTVDINGVSYTYHENYTDALGNVVGVIVKSGATYYLLTNAALGNGTLVGDTANIAETYTYAVCFLPGTLIATPEGERVIESLQIGEMITLANGTQKPVKWLGKMTVNLNMFNRHSASPILIKAGALGDGLPKRDLYTSYRHAFALDGVLAIAGVLVNGTSIVQCSDWPEETVTFYQVEVEGHELMLAEGAASETFGEDGDNRALFDNADEYHALYPNSVAAESMDLGRVIVARQLPRAVKERIAAAAESLGYGKGAVA